MMTKINEEKLEMVNGGGFFGDLFDEIAKVATIVKDVAVSAAETFVDAGVDIVEHYGYVKEMIEIIYKDFPLP